MSKKIKILLTLLLIALLLVLYLAVKSKPLSRETIQTASQPQKVDLAVLENNYKNNTGAIVQEYSELIKKDDLKPEELESLKNKLLALKVPAKFKELHLSLVLTLSKIGESLALDAQEEIISGLQEINEIKAKYTWLN